MTDKAMRVGLRGWREANSKARRLRVRRLQIGTVGWMAIVLDPIVFILGVNTFIVGGIALVAMVCLIIGALITKQLRHIG